MSYAERLLAEIEAKIEPLQADGRPIEPRWIAHEICNDHRGAIQDGDDADFWLHCGYLEARRAAGYYIRKRFEPDDDEQDRQPTLPGFEHVQTHYVVTREKQEVAVPVAEMTDAEIDARISRFRAAAVELFAHADELERYKLFRKMQAAD